MNISASRIMSKRLELKLAKLAVKYCWQQTFSCLQTNINVLPKFMFILKNRIDYNFKGWTWRRWAELKTGGKSTFKLLFLEFWRYSEKWCTGSNMFSCVSVSYLLCFMTTFHDLLLRKYISCLLLLFLQVSLLTRRSGVVREKISLCFPDVYHKKTFFPSQIIKYFLFHFSVNQGYEYAWKF